MRPYVAAAKPAPSNSAAFGAKCHRRQRAPLRSLNPFCRAVNRRSFQGPTGWIEPLGCAPLVRTQGFGPRPQSSRQPINTHPIQSLPKAGALPGSAQPENSPPVDYAPVLFLSATMPGEADLPFTVELWDSRFVARQCILATAADFLTTKAAYEAVVRRRPGEAILLSQGARIILRSDRP
jgi:hypothetical protein